MEDKGVGMLHWGRRDMESQLLNVSACPDSLVDL